MANPNLGLLKSPRPPEKIAPRYDLPTQVVGQGNPTLQPAPQDTRDRRAKHYVGRDMRITSAMVSLINARHGGGGGGMITHQYTLNAAADKAVDAGATVTQVPVGTIFDSGKEVVLTPVPSNGLIFGFLVWTGDVEAGHESDNPLTVTMDSNKAITATFESL
jgi:hypothetical protein